MGLPTIEVFESQAAKQVVLLVTPETEAGVVMEAIGSFHVGVNNDDTFGHLRTPTCRKEALQYILKDVALVCEWHKPGEASSATLDISEDIL